jgi:hypothetical protein
MNKQRFVSLLGAALAILALAGGVLAMSSSSYGLDWFVPLNGSGGPASSANYSVNLTVGQTGIGTSASPNYQACLGYWCGQSAQDAGSSVYLPVVMKN